MRHKNESLKTVELYKSVAFSSDTLKKEKTTDAEKQGIVFWIV